MSGSRERTRWWDHVYPVTAQVSKPERVLGGCATLQRTYLTQKEKLISGLYDPTWKRISGSSKLVYDEDAFRVIEPTRPCLDSALESLLENEPMTISPGMYDVIVKAFPCLKDTNPVVGISEHPTIDIDLDVFQVSVQMYRDYVSRFYCPQQMLADSVQNLSTACGPQGKILGCSTKGELLEYDYDYAMSWCDREDDPLIFGISGKTELIKRSKYEIGRIRPFEPQGAESHFECAFQFGASNAKMAEHGNNIRSPIAIGFVQQRMFIEFMTILGKQKKVFSDDADGWDKRFQQLFMQLEFGWRLECAITFDYMTLTMRKGKEVLTKLYQRIFDGFAKPLIWYAPGGFFICAFIMPSGCSITSYANSTGHSFIHFVHRVLSQKAITGKVDCSMHDFNRDVMIKIYGDDNLGALTPFADERLIPFYSHEERGKTYALFGQRLKPGAGLWTDSPVGHTWLGFKCDANMHPRFDVEKAFCSMLWPQGTLSPPERYMKAICLMVNCAFEPPETIQVFIDYLHALVDANPECSFPRPTAITSGTIPSLGELRKFWTRTESSSGWVEVFENLCKTNYDDEQIEEEGQQGNISSEQGGSESYPCRREGFSQSRNCPSAAEGSGSSHACPKTN